MTETQISETQISLFDALAQGWSRMVQMLFRPFDVRKWFVVGFAAWLAGLADGGRKGGARYNTRYSPDDGGREIAESARAGWEWLVAHQVMAGMIAAGVLVLLALIVVLLWVSSRGKFVFLDNVIHDRATIVEPWHRLRRQGDSLFAFRLAVILLLFPIIAGLVGLCVWLALRFGGWAQLEAAAAIAGAVAIVVLGFLFLVVLLYTFFFLEAFVVPLMYRFDLGVMDAWRRFLGLFGARPWPFLACGLFVFVLWILVMAAVVTAGLMTCCLGFVLLALPYIGTVVLLPVLITFRAFTVAFLAQLEPQLVFDPPGEAQAVAG